MFDGDDKEVKVQNPSRILHGIFAIAFGVSMWLIGSLNVALFQPGAGFFRSALEALALIARVPGALGMTLLHIGPWSGRAVETIADFTIDVLFFASVAHWILRLLKRRRSNG
jgi:hypothetical protein